MQLTHITSSIFAVAVVLSGHLSAQQMSCAQVHAMAGMARASSTKELNTFKSSAGESYLAQMVFTFRAFELKPSKATAAAVLDFLPHDDSHRQDWYSLSGFICDKEQMRDVTSLALIQTRMSRDFARSVILRPERMYQYISYPVIMGRDPHDDYAVRMAAVCRSRHLEFVAAVDRLPEKDKAWFLRIVFDPSGCRTITYPEAD